jgi:hypothetical protein
MSVYDVVKQVEIVRALIGPFTGPISSSSAGRRGNGSQVVDPFRSLCFCKQLRLVASAQLRKCSTISVAS